MHELVTEEQPEKFPGLLTHRNLDRCPKGA